METLKTRVEVGDIVNYGGIEYRVTMLGDSGTSAIKVLSNIPIASLCETDNPKNKNAKRDWIWTKHKMVTIKSLKKENTNKYAEE